MLIDHLSRPALKESSDRQGVTTRTSVTTIGTCRIADPIAASEAHLPIRRNMTNVYGFVHTSKEILQQLDVLEGRQIPQELVRFLASGTYETPVPRDPADLYIVEISSAKEIHFEGHLLQINCLDRVFNDRRELLEAFFRHKYAAERPARAEALNLLPDFHQADPVERSFLLEGHVHITKREELEADLLTIAARLPAPTMFVCHIDVADGGGRMIESRSRLCNWVREIAAEHGLPLFDPAPQVVAYGRSRALANDGRDINHYTTEFKPLIGAMLYEAAMQPLTRAGGNEPAPAARPVPPTASPSIAKPEVAFADSIRLERPPAAPAAPPDAPSPVPPPREATAPAPVLPTNEVRSVAREAKTRIARGDMDEAEVLLRGAVMDHPGAAELFGLLGAVAYHRGDNTAALADLQRALHLDHRCVEPRLLLVKIAQRLNRLEEACVHALELVELVPQDHKALTVAAKALLKAKRFHDAASVWRRISMLRPELSGPLAEIARCELKGRNLEEAVKAADAALGRDAADVLALTLKAEALQRLKRMDALAAVAQQLVPFDPSAAMALVPALTATAHHEHAAAVIAAVRRQGHSNASDPIMQAGLIRSLTQRARAATERGEATAAAAAWNAIRLIDPENRKAISGLRKLVAPIRGLVRERTLAGDLPGAIAACMDGLAIDAAEVRLLREHAKLRERQGDWAEAMTAWEALANSEDGRPELILRAGRAAIKAGVILDALRLYGALPEAERHKVASTIASLNRKLVSAMRQDFTAGDLDNAVLKAKLVLSIDGRNLPATRLLARAVSGYRKLYKVALAEGDIAEQERLSRRILDIDPNRTDALRALSRLHASAKRPREAIELLERLTQLEPDEPRNWHKLASVCRQARRYDLGVTAALRAVELEPANAKGLERLSDMLNRQALAA
ncbi:tetratricopeptide repeat protein [Roseomonas sp. KE2513]|uniref:tetratricopeptide repeat protein n=1 Tax=Roseomonas sp. KE2513 TaxID=2479202 RepID=UPI0018DFCB07|nr:tetratricopeptide repeat protein [Roseomonas sp. KE2513]